MNKARPIGILEAYIKRFLVDADPTRIRCIDERRTQNSTTGVQIPGATSGIIDALKVVHLIPEDEAWHLARDKGIPIDAHDDDQQGARGCGYNLLVEMDPLLVGAPQAASAASRLARVPPARVLHSVGPHAPVHAAINYMPRKTLDTDRILAAGVGVFNLDAWALPEIADKLGLFPSQKPRLVAHILDSYRRAIAALTRGAIREFIVLR